MPPEGLTDGSGLESSGPGDMMTNDVLGLECTAIPPLNVSPTPTHQFQISENIMNNFMAPVGGTNYKIKTKT